QAVALQPDGRIVIAGYASNGSNLDFAIVRLNSDGSFDDGSGNDTTPGDSFAISGIRRTDFNARNDNANDVAIQPDGRIVVVGNATNTNGKNDFAVARYNGNGTPDNSFGSNGNVSKSILGANDVAFKVALQTDGKILLAGRSFGPNDYDFAVARFN